MGGSPDTRVYPRRHLAAAWVRSAIIPRGWQIPRSSIELSTPVWWYSRRCLHSSVLCLPVIGPVFTCHRSCVYLYRTQFSIGTRLTSLLASHRATFVNTWHAQLAISLGFLGTASIITGHLLTAYPAYSSRLDWCGVFITPGLVWCIHRGQRGSCSLVPGCRLSSLVSPRP
jgi:hypothetical protein